MDTGTIAAFLAVDLLLVFTPGADWAYAISAGLQKRALLPAVAGLVAGYAGYTLLAVAGLVVIVASSTTVLTALTVLGAAYLVWLGWGVLARPISPGVATEAVSASARQIMLKGAGISGLNPKALLLYFSLFPQFIDPSGSWPVAAQTGLLSTLHMVSCAVVYLTVGILARTVLAARPAAARAVTRTSGAMMIIIGGFLLVEGLV
ncbi:Threonine/homoserine/homoserine lactone efflux protein [Streptomyces sp. yr375]|uniref:LysE family translocator n=1 Tax=Streptomyces sp. yr375 TaxID=1761906 RepID=UPI0008AD468A|nr:LysE family translocator [Streptomyces sp. yr375]SES49543.1 Threonine/homoserine/homoserine lactone efflux protein [Streptomyces sp. yr375]